MPITLDDFHKLKERVERLRQAKARGEGAYSEVMSEVEKVFGCKTLQEAEDLLEKVRSERQALFEAYSKAKSKFERKHADRLKELEDE